MIDIINLNKTFIFKDGRVDALKDVSLKIEDGDIYGVIGMSGAGKSTLVRCINALEKFDSGDVIIDGVSINDLNEKSLRDLRKNVTMIFQNFNLLLQSNCLKNVMFPLMLNKVPKEEAKKRAYELLELVGLKDKAKAYPSQLSGGQQQRVAIARSLANNPKVLLCDEATSALDPNTTNQILDLLRDINQKFNITIVIITHQMSVVENICNKVAILDGGEIVEKGIVSDVFSHPKSKAAKKLVYPEFESSSIVSGVSDITLRVVFNGSESAGQPLIASLAKDKGIVSNIVYASIKNINEKVYGSIILSFKTRKDANEAIDYISQVKNVNVGEFNIYD